MNIEELAKEVGVDVSDISSDNSTQSESKPKSDHIDDSVNLIQSCKSIYEEARKNDVEWRWNIGNRIDNAYEHPDDYEQGILKTLSEELEIAISDLSRFRKFFRTFDIEKVREQASKGYTWSHFKIISDMPDDDVKKRIIAKYENIVDVPKTKDLQNDIYKERDEYLEAGGGGGSNSAAGGNSDVDDKVKSVSPLRSVNGALKSIDKLGDFLGDIVLQKKNGVDFGSDKQEENYNDKMNELEVRLSELNEIYIKLFGKGAKSIDEEDENKPE